MVGQLNDKAKVYDYQDIQVGVLENAARARARPGARPEPELE